MKVRRVAVAYTFDDASWAGGRNYFASLFRALRSSAQSEVQLVFVTGTTTSTTLPHEFPWLEVQRTKLLDRLRPAWLVRQAGLRWFDTDPLLARYLRRLDIDLLSHSGYLGSKPGLKTLPWLFDFQFMHLPEHWTTTQLRWVSRRYRAACEQGDGIIVSSRDASNDLKRFAPGLSVPVHVLSFVSNHEPDPRPSDGSSLRSRYDLPERYFHLPNQFWTHKNHGVVIDALAVLQGEGVDAVVVCTGNPSDPRSPYYFEGLMAHAKGKGVAERFKVLGLVPYADSQALMANAVAVLNPSRFEGWSTTVEEAKTLHKPLLLSDIAVHREQAPAMATFFSPDSSADLAAAMLASLSAPAARASAMAIEHSYRDRSSRFAHSYLDIVRSTLGPAASDVPALST